MTQQLLGLFIVSGMLGIMVFFTIAVAPTVFKVLPQEWASKYVRAFFPKYYLFLGIFTCLATYLINDATQQILLGLCALFFFISLTLLTPAINRASDAGNKKKFGLLHGLSILINVIQLGVFIYIFF